MLTPPLVLAVLSAGLLGGVHCIGMCGGISSMLASAGKPVRKTIPIIHAPIEPSPGSRDVTDSAAPVPADPTGRQASLSVTADTPQIETLANRERELLDTLNAFLAKVKS